MISTVAGYLPTTACVGIKLSEFGTWMTSEQRRIYLLCRRMLQDPDEADSATQDVFFKAYRALSRGDAVPEEIDLARWITRIAVNTCLDRLRSKAWRLWGHRIPAKDEQLILDMTPTGSPDAERQAFASQIALRLERALRRLSDRQRAVFVLRHYDAMSLEEIAASLQLDSGTVKAHLFRAITKLREELKDLYASAKESPHATGSLRRPGVTKARTSE